jgi:hypothetical protein
MNQRKPKTTAGRSQSPRFFADGVFSEMVICLNAKVEMLKN